jgi:hypothetical protein
MIYTTDHKRHKFRVSITTQLICRVVALFTLAFIKFYIWIKRCKKPKIAYMKIKRVFGVEGLKSTLCRFSAKMWNIQIELEGIRLLNPFLSFLPPYPLILSSDSNQHWILKEVFLVKVMERRLKILDGCRDWIRIWKTNLISLMFSRLEIFVYIH